MVAIAGSRRPGPRVTRAATDVARVLASAGYVVASLSDCQLGREVLGAAAPLGPTVGMLWTPFPGFFTPPIAVTAHPALWLSLFAPDEPACFDGPDAADRALGAIVSAVVVVDTGGVPDAFYVAEAALAAGRPVFLPRRPPRHWPMSLPRPLVHVGQTLDEMLRTLAHVVPLGG